jgi:RNA polymerase sigma-70 factor (ECF subfamily)
LNGWPKAGMVVCEPAVGGGYRLARKGPVLEPIDSSQFEQLVLPHLDAAYNLARWLTRQKQDADDVVQEAYLRAFRFFPTFRGGDARAWLMTIVRNTCYNWLQANRRLADATEFDEELFTDDSQVPNPEEIALQNATGALVRRAIDKLPAHFREVLILRELEGLSYREIADITGMPAGTVMSSLARARRRLREILSSSIDWNRPEKSGIETTLALKTKPRGAPAESSAPVKTL